ncbi:MAG: polysaccharide biosynthesis protein, partial [Ruminococcus sp.]|nr:polysaccharide biosynthesis protein [Ruminococcus sp.]
MKKIRECAAKFSIRKYLLVFADAFIVISAALITNFILSFSNHSLTSGEMIIPIFTSTICCFAFLFIFGAYSKMWRYSTKKDYLCCIAGTVFGIMSTWLFDYVSTGDSIEPLYIILHTLISTAGICLFRVIFRSAFIDMSKVKAKFGEYTRTMIIGGGQAAHMLISEILSSQNDCSCDDKKAAQYEPVCIIDDNRNKIGKNINGIEIVGTTYD